LLRTTTTLYSARSSFGVCPAILEVTVTASKGHDRILTHNRKARINTQDAKKGIATQNRKKPVDNEECKKAIDTKASTQSIHNAVGIETIDRLRRLVIAKPSPRISFYRLSPAVFAVLASVNTGSGGFDVGHGEMICVFVVFCF